MKRLCSDCHTLGGCWDAPRLVHSPEVSVGPCEHCGAVAGLVRCGERCALTFTDEEKLDLLSLLNHWRYDTSTLVAYTNESGEWVDVEPDWDLPMTWLENDGD